MANTEKLLNLRDELDMACAELKRIDPIILQLFARQKDGEDVDAELSPLLARFNKLGILVAEIELKVLLELKED